MGEILALRSTLAEDPVHIIRSICYIKYSRKSIKAIQASKLRFPDERLGFLSPQNISYSLKDAIWSIPTSSKVQRKRGKKDLGACNNLSTNCILCLQNLRVHAQQNESENPLTIKCKKSFRHLPLPQSAGSQTSRTRFSVILCWSPMRWLSTWQADTHHWVDTLKRYQETWAHYNRSLFLQIQTDSSSHFHYFTINNSSLFR